MNHLQKTTKSGKPIIDRTTKTPIYTHSNHNRTNSIKQQLGYNTNKSTMTHEDKWEAIKLDIKLNNL